MAYFDKYGVEFSDDRKMLVRAPLDLQGEYTIPFETRQVLNKAFANCPNITKIVVGTYLEAIGPESFLDIPNVVIEGGINKIVSGLGFSPFPSNYKGSGYVLGGSKVINGYTEGHLTYSDDSKTELLVCAQSAHGEIIIPNSVTRIECSFEKCKSISSIIIGEKVRELSLGNDLASLKHIEVAPNNSAYCTLDGVLFSKDKSILIKYPIQKEGEYVIPESVTSIEKDAFRGCSGLTNVIIPNSVANIGANAFMDCSNITNIEVPNSVIRIGEYAFAKCSNLTSIIVGENVQEVGSSAFYLAHMQELSVDWRARNLSKGICQFIYKSTKFRPEPCNITSVIFGEHVEVIPPHICEGLKRLQSVILPDSVKVIGENAFYDCSSLSTIKWSSNIHTIGKNAFANCDSLVAIEFPQSTEDIKEGAFANCWRLRSIMIPSSVASIGKSVFRNCTNLVAIDVDTDNPHFSSINGVLLDKSKTVLLKYPSLQNETAYIIPDGIQCIDDSAFDNCEKLVSVSIPNDVTYIGDFAFEACHNLARLTLPKSITHIGDFAFSGCYGLDDHSYDVLVNRASFCKRKLIEIGVEEGYSRLMRLEMVHKGSLLRPQSPPSTSINKKIEPLPKSNIVERQDMKQVKYLFFDTETTGLPNDYKASVKDSRNWPRLVQIAWLLVENDGNVVKQKSTIIYPNGFTIPQDATNVHHISTEQAKRDGLPLRDVLEEFMQDFEKAECLVAHNIEFDQHIIGAELYRIGEEYDEFMGKQAICTMKSSTNYCALPKLNEDYGYKWPKLEELYYKLFNRNFNDAHDALADITATKECFFELKKRGII